MTKQNLKQTLQDYQVFNLQSKRSKAGAVSLYLINARGPLKVANAGGYGYDKLSACFEDFFRKLGMEVGHLDFGCNSFDKFLNDNNLKMNANYGLIDGQFVSISRK